jgi:hypothetical protein
MLRGMRFSTWIAKQPRGTAARIQRDSGLSPRTIANLCAETYPRASFETAQKVAPLTGGDVSIEEMCSPPPPKRRRTKRAA